MKLLTAVLHVHRDVQIMRRCTFFGLKHDSCGNLCPKRHRNCIL